MKNRNKKEGIEMNHLNDRLQKKDLGVFYTPEPYAKKAAELVLIAANRAINAGKRDYIILDRCSGTGNLEAALIGLYDENGDELISHAVVSTYQYHEHEVLKERLGDKVREIIPPADAMSEEYINNHIIKSYINDKDCAIIIFENPPYRDTSDFAKSKTKEGSFVYGEFIKEGTNQSDHRDLSNLFTWSAFKYYLRDDNDYYIVIAPIKYWKTLGLVNKKFIDGYLFNKKHFNASTASVSCILWSNEDDYKNDKIELECYDIINAEIKKEHNIIFNKIHKSFSDSDSFFDKSVRTTDVETSVFCEANGNETRGRKTTGKSYYNENIIAYLRVTGYATTAGTRYLTRQRFYDGVGSYLRSDDYKEKLPLFAAKLLPQDNWYEKDVYFTTSDGGDLYTKDEDFLKSCLIYTCLSNQNKCLSFTGSDGRYYKNELCFDEDTLASKDLKAYQLDDVEKELLEIWSGILKKAKKTKNYNGNLSYGVYQVTKELNTFDRIATGKSAKRVYHYPGLKEDLDVLRLKLKNYYKSHIWNKMFEYELVK